MKIVPFFSDAISIAVHTATHEVHVGAPITLAEFGNGQTLALYENGAELHCKRADGAFIEGPEHVAPKGAEVVKRAPMVPASVQVQTTIIEEDDIQTCDQSSNAATHWSVYLRGADGMVEHVADFALNPDTRLEDNKGMARVSALCRAAALSMEHNVPIEPIR